MVVEAVSALGFVGAVDAIAVERAAFDLGQIPVPDLIGVFGQRDAAQFARAARIEETELDALGVLAEEREVYAAAVPGRAERIRPPRENLRAAGRPHARTGRK